MDPTPQIALPSKRTQRPFRWKPLVAFGTVFAILLALLWWVGVIGGNVREVEAGRFYRSAQLSGSNLKNVLRRYHIRSVVNLRGSNKKAFYDSEIEVCRDLGIEHFDISMSAYRLPRPQELQDLLTTLDAAPRPTLIHCQQGADRSGLASTIYQSVYEGIPLDKAEQDQLTWRYGHIAFVGTWRLDRFFDLYRQTRDGLGLRTWIEQTYPGVYARETAKK